MTIVQCVSQTPSFFYFILNLEKVLRLKSQSVFTAHLKVKYKYGFNYGSQNSLLVNSFISATPSPEFRFGVESENACHLLFYDKESLRLSSQPLFLNLNLRRKVPY